MKKPKTVLQYSDHILVEDIKKHIEELMDIKKEIRKEADKENRTRRSTTPMHSNLHANKDRVQKELRIRYMALAWLRNRSIQDVECVDKRTAYDTRPTQLRLQRIALQRVVASSIGKAKTIYKLVNTINEEDTKDRIRKEVGHTMLSLEVVIRDYPDNGVYYEGDYYEVNWHSSDSLRQLMRMRGPKDRERLFKALLPESLEGYEGTIYADLKPGKYRWEGSAVFDEVGPNTLVDTFTLIKEDVQE